MNLNVESLQEEIKRQAVDKANRIVSDYFQMFSATLQYEQQLMYSSATSQQLNTVYDPEHAELTQREVFRKLINNTHVEVENITDAEGNIKSRIHVMVDDSVDFGNAYVRDSFNMLLDNVKTRMGYNI